MNLDSNQIARRVAAALAGVVHPGTGDDVVSSGRVRDLQVTEDGVVRFRFLLQPDDPGTLVRQARAAAEAVDGVGKVKIDISLPAAGSARPKGKPPLGPGNVPAPTPNPNLLPGVARVIAVSSGKGGVGKSTVAVNLAASLAAEGHRVGVLDADVYGPNVPLMFGERRRPSVVGPKGAEKIEPLEAHGVRLMSLGFLLEEQQPAIMRGPLISGILKQFLEQVEWGELDFLVVDMPPGTGDAQLSLVQTVRVDGVVMVTTPQDVATGDVLRAIRMFERTHTRVLGVVENMSGFVCPCCGQRYEIFGRGGGIRLAEQTGVQFLGDVPLEMEVRQGGDTGEPVVLAAPESPAGMALREVARRIAEQVAAVAKAGSGV
ncbi:MAG TPA: Mrp/NBP35 family ATP-binding protein [Longimicrobiaceae bacterium]|nr:Mrp/NBP35 family ATP-binding protein [Longimicrobiaceae bacterium]